MTDSIDTASEALRKAISFAVATSNSLQIGVVVDVAGTGRNVSLSVDPKIGLMKPDGTVSKYSRLYDVPLVPVGCGGVTIECTPVVGDIVLLLFSDRPLDNWKTDKSNGTPPGPRSHSLSDAIAIPTDWAGLSGGAVTVSAGGVSLGVSASGVVVTGNLDVSGVCRVGTASPASTVTLNTHTHTAPSGGGTTSVPNPG